MVTKIYMSKKMGFGKKLALIRYLAAIRKTFDCPEALTSWKAYWFIHCFFSHIIKLHYRFLFNTIILMRSPSHVLGYKKLRIWIACLISSSSKTIQVGSFYLRWISLFVGLLSVPSLDNSIISFPAACFSLKNA